MMEGILLLYALENIGESLSIGVLIKKIVIDVFVK